jgi:hypothetical protein
MQRVIDSDRRKKAAATLGTEDLETKIVTKVQGQIPRYYSTGKVNFVPREVPTAEEILSSIQSFDLNSGCNPFMYYTTATSSSLSSTQDFIDDKVDLESLMPYHLLIDLRSKNELKFVKLQTQLQDSN